jgi:hypothetical protein
MHVDRQSPQPWLVGNWGMSLPLRVVIPRPSSIVDSVNRIDDSCLIMMCSIARMTLAGDRLFEPVVYKTNSVSWVTSPRHCVWSGLWSPIQGCEACTCQQNSCLWLNIVPHMEFCHRIGGVRFLSLSANSRCSMESPWRWFWLVLPSALEDNKDVQTLQETR